MSGASRTLQPRPVELTGPSPRALMPTSIDHLGAEMDWLEAILRLRHGDRYNISAHESYGLDGKQIAVCSDMRCFTARGYVLGREVIDHVIVKLLPEDEQMRRVVIDHNMSHCETMVYKDLLPQLVAFERRHGTRDVQDMTVTCLYAELLEGPECAIVLDNFQKKGYWTTESLQLDKPQMNAAVRCLARMAATSYCWLEETNTVDLPYLLENHLPDNAPVADYILMGINRLSNRLENMGHTGLLQKLTNMQQSAVQLLNTFLGRRAAFRVLCHGDFRDGNLLLRERQDGGWQLRVVDWQGSRLGGPSLDLLYLMLFSLPRSVMIVEESDVLAAYVRNFNEKLAELGRSERYSPEQLQEEFNEAKLFGLIWCLAAIQFWDRVPGWVEHTMDLALEVDALGQLDDFA